MSSTQSATFPPGKYTLIEFLDQAGIALPGAKLLIPDSTVLGGDIIQYLAKGAFDFDPLAGVALENQQRAMLRVSSYEVEARPHAVRSHPAERES